MESINFDMIVDVKDSFDKPDIMNVFSECMYMPTKETLKKRAFEYMAKDTICIFGFYDNDNIIGVIAVEKLSEKLSEIKGIAVDSNYRNQGVGKTLIKYVIKAMNIVELIAETDVDAVGFYKNCGFETVKFTKVVEDGAYERYKCSFIHAAESGGMER